MKIAVCVPTYKRPRGLAKLLEALGKMTFSGADPKLRIIVVDNDPKGSAHAVFENFKNKLGWPLEYHVEKRRGIPFARNKCLEIGRDSDLISFLDDDEQPPPHWLDTFTSALKNHGADVVTGPVVPRFVERPPQWIEAGGFFDSQRHVDGARLDVAFTNNVLFHTRILEDLDPWFNERMQLSGGSDSHFFRRVASAGGKIVWVENAEVYEDIPPSRVSVRWLMQRSYRVGSVMTFIRFDQKPFPIATAITFLAAARSGLLGVGKVLPGIVSSKHIAVSGLRSLSYAAGLLTGIRGLHYDEYQKVHGS